MKTNSNAYSRLATVILFAVFISCSITPLSPCFARSGKEQVDANSREVNLLVQRLRNDGLIDEVNGFVVEKKQGQLIINGQRQANAIAGKYLANIKQAEIRAEVYSFRQRLKMHPGASIQTLILPVMFSSPCMDTKPRKPGC